MNEIYFKLQRESEGPWKQSLECSASVGNIQRYFLSEEQHPKQGGEDVYLFIIPTEGAYFLFPDQTVMAETNIQNYYFGEHVASTLESVTLPGYNDTTLPT